MYPVLKIHTTFYLLKQLHTSMEVKRGLRIALILLLIVAFGCDSGDSGPPSLSGDWELRTQINEVNLTYDLSITEESQNLSGTGTLTVEDQNSSQAATFDVTAIRGTHDHPSVDIEVDTEDGSTSQFDGTVEGGGERMTGTLTFPSGEQQEVTIRKE